MPEHAGLNEREEYILQAAVQCYITTAEPVGSRTIVKRFGLELSPATVRNVMADLEEAGFLEQVHTSSGRVPTDRGYRYYVDYLMRVQELTLAERAQIERELSEKLNDADEVLHQTSQLLALITQQTGIVKAPDGGAATVRYMEVVPVTGSRAAVLIADNYGRVHTVMVPFENAQTRDDVARLNNFLNQHMRGLAMDRMATTLHGVLRSFLDEERRLAEQALQILRLVPADRPGQLYLEGASMMFEQPEFRDVERAREVFGLFEERDRLIELLRASGRSNERSLPTIVIGSESHDAGLREISVVASPYRVGQEPVGMVGVLGPRRMPYQRLTAIVDYTAEMLSRLLTKFAG